jgi:hypothetical protein
MAWLPVNIAMILGHQDLTLGEVEATLQWRKIAITHSESPFDSDASLCPLRGISPKMSARSSSSRDIFMLSPL